MNGDHAYTQSDEEDSCAATLQAALVFYARQLHYAKHASRAWWGSGVQ